MSDPLLTQLKLLTGRKIPPSPRADVTTDPDRAFQGGGISYSQLNELLLSFECDRVSVGFFNYFLIPPGLRERTDTNYNYQTPHRIESLDAFQSGVENFRKAAMLRFGNFKYGFKDFREKNFDAIAAQLDEYTPLDEAHYTTRPAPIVDLDGIERKNTYLLGAIAGRDVKALKAKDASSHSLSSEEKTLIYLRDGVVEKAMTNYNIYLCYDYMDVYVATSMRHREDFYEVYEFVNDVFAHPELSGLNVRYFDPTQADPQERIDKSLLEGLMLKRAKCTVYCAQESDTFGKDSELAATMAQGKPVVAYVPRVRNLSQHAEKLKTIAKECRSGTVIEYLKDMFPHRHPRYVSTNCDWFAQVSSDEELALKLAEQDKQLYEGRAEKLQEIHPLSLQVNINTGVANGVLVVRDGDDCARVLRRILLRNLEFTIEEQKSEREGDPGFVLRETITRSIFRVVTGDSLLTNSFWNFYPEGAE